MNINNTYLLFIIVIITFICDNVYGQACEDSIKWTAIPGVLSHISVGDNGEVYGVNGAWTGGGGQVYRYDFESGSFEQIPGLLQDIDVGKGAVVWGVGSVGDVYEYKTFSNEWSRLPGILRSVTVAGDDTIYGVTPEDYIFKYDFGSSSWIQIDGMLETISAGSQSNVWGTNAGNIYKRDVLNKKWDQIQGELFSVSVSSDNFVYGIAETQEIFRYDVGDEERAPHWTKVCGLLDQISVGNGLTVWGINGGTVYRGEPYSEITNMTFNLKAAIITDEKTVAVSSMTCINNNGPDGGDNSIPWSFTYNIEHSKSFEHSTGIALSIGTEFETGVPFVANGEISVELTVSEQFTWGETNSASKEYESGFNIICRPGEHIQGQAIVSTANLNVPYTIKRKVKGSDVIYESHGIFHSDATWNLRLETERVNL